MKRYESYSPTEVKWLGEIPSGWEIKPAKRVFNVIGSGTTPKSSDSKYYLGNIPWIQSGDLHQHFLCETAKHISNIAISECSALKLYKAPFISLAMYGASIGNLSISQIDAYTNQACCNLAGCSENLDYCFYALKSAQNYVISLSAGGTQPNIKQEIVKNLLLPVPPREEQDQIVRYLDWQVSKINRLIAAKRKKESTYVELRKAIVDKGILHGFDHSNLKDSGIYWLGEIPSQWEVLPLKRVCRVNASISDVIKNMSDSDRVTFLPMEKVSATGEIDCSIKKPLREVRTGFSSFAKGDVIVAKITPCFENGKGACLNALDTDVGFGTTEFINLRPTERVLSKYLYMITTTRPFRKMGEEVMTGSAGQKRIPAGYIKNFALGIPPIEEQKEIISAIEKQLAQIDRLIETENQTIKCLLEYKTRIVSDVVTGQFDVRGVAVPDFEYVEDSGEVSAEEEVAEADEEA